MLTPRIEPMSKGEWGALLTKENEPHLAKLHSQGFEPSTSRKRGERRHFIHKEKESAYASNKFRTWDLTQAKGVLRSQGEQSATLLIPCTSLTWPRRLDTHNLTRPGGIGAHKTHQGSMMLCSPQERSDILIATQPWHATKSSKTRQCSAPHKSRALHWEQILLG